MRFTILVVDDNADFRETLKAVLEQADLTVLAAREGREAFALALDSKPDLILSDVAMPVDDGLTLCRKLKQDPRTASIPVVLISGEKKNEAEQVEGIEGGADDYLTKPFPPGLLRAKIHAVLRRYEAPEELKEFLGTQGLVLDVQARTVALKGRRVSLTRKEFDLLTTFLRKPGRVLSVPYLLETVWGHDPADYNDPATVQVHLSSLRKKLGPGLGRRIVTVPGLGYRLDIKSKPPKL